MFVLSAIRTELCYSDPSLTLVHRTHAKFRLERQDGAIFHLSQESSNRGTSSLLDPRAQFILDTDASAHLIEAVLSQVHDREERVVAYYSSTLSWPERNNCITRRELLAVIRSALHIHRYLYDQQFCVCTIMLLSGCCRTFVTQNGRQLDWSIICNSTTFRSGAGTKHASQTPCLDVLAIQTAASIIAS